MGTFISRQQTDAKEHKSERAKQTAPKLDIRSMVSVDDMPELFVSFDSKYRKQKAVFLSSQVIVELTEQTT